MAGRSVLKVGGLAAAAALVAGTVKVLRGPRTDVFDDGREWLDGAPWPPLALVDTAGCTATAIATDGEVDPGDTEVIDLTVRRWVEPVDGACPPGHPVKAKLRSGIFHVPGGLAYERTSPDRCYRTPADAEADGLRASKR